MTQTATQRVVTPADADGVAATLATCARDHAAVVAYGGGTLQSLGNAPQRCDVALHLGALRGMRDYDPRDLTFGADAGTTLADIARALAANGQWLPFDAPHANKATIGGTLAAGWGGPRRAVYGRPRDLTIGSTVALADGTLAHAGGMVVKNVTGYDMSKLFIGSLGTLGVIVRANLKALPRPATRQLAVAPVGEDERDRVIATLGGLAVEPVAALLIDGFDGVAAYGDAPSRVAVLFEGSAPVVDRGMRDARSALGRAGVAETTIVDDDRAERIFTTIVDAYVETHGARTITYRASGLPSTASARARLAAMLAAEHGLTWETIADLRTGDAIVRVSAPNAATLAAALVAFDAAVRGAIERTVVIAGAPARRAAIDAWGPVPSTIATMRAIKAHFDPTGILSPGRYVGAI